MWRSLQARFVAPHRGRSRQISVCGRIAISIACSGRVWFDLEAARAEYLRALQVFGPQAPPSVTHPARVGLANVHHDLGEYREAAARYEEIASAAEAVGDARGAALNRRNLARTLLEMGRPDDALRELDRVRAALETERDLEELAATRNTTGIVYRSLGDLRRAMEEFAEAAGLILEGEAERRGVAEGADPVVEIRRTRLGFDAARAEGPSGAGDEEGRAAVPGAGKIPHPLPLHLPAAVEAQPVSFAANPKSSGQDADRAVREAAALLRPGGKIAFSFYPLLLGPGGEDLLDEAFRRVIPGLAATARKR